MEKHLIQQLQHEAEALLRDNPTIRELEVLSVDINGHFFGKRYPIANLKSFVSDGLAFPQSMFLLSTLGEPVEGMHFGINDGDPDAHFYLIPGSLSINDWGNQTRLQVMATTLNGDKPTQFEPRNILMKVLNAFSKEKMYPVVAFELEFYLFDGKRDKHDLLRIVRNPKTGRLDTPTVLSSSRIGDFEVVIDDIIRACEMQNIETGAISAEMGPGQFEINFNHHADVLRAADETCLFKRTVIEIAKKHGLTASFIAKPMLGQPGNGLHMHISVVDDKGNNIFEHNNQVHQILLHSIGGLIDTMPASMSFWAPNINSYRRFVGGTNCAPVSLTWGKENRTVAFRIPIAKAGAWRIENRVPGADANPYLAMATTLASMLHGIKHKLEPGKPTVDTVIGRDANLPLNLNSALGASLGSEALINILGCEFVEIFCRHRESETAAFEQFISPREYDWYL